MTEAKQPVLEPEWPERLTIIRYEDGGFSATEAIPPDGAKFTQVYTRATQSPEPQEDRACPEVVIGNLSEFTAFGIWWSDLDRLFRQRFLSIIAAALATAQAKQREVDSAIAASLYSDRRWNAHYRNAGLSIAEAICAGGKQ